ncbi:MAG: sigma-70 family RNA polymerase sigma factor [Clostridia bacterium]|nr:sigma-70 family RNA polymerase sigma factor [Clostridia bacterium]
MISRELLEKAKQNDERAVEEVFECFKPLFRKLTRSFHILGSDDDDVIQEGMLGLYLAITSYNFEETATFETFAIKCIYRKIYNAISKANSQKNRPINNSVNIDEISDLVFTGNDPMDLILKKELQERFSDILEFKLSKIESNVTKLFMEGYTYQEIADKLNTEVKAVDNALFRSRKKIQKNLSDTL